MVSGFVAETEYNHSHDDPAALEKLQLEQAIKRNFSGLDDLNPIELFSGAIPVLKPCLKVCHNYLLKRPTSRYGGRG